MSTHKQPSKKLQAALAVFMEYTPPGRISRNLRNMFLGYLMAYKDDHSFDMDDMLVDLTSLFELLDAAEEECLSIS